VSRSSLSEHVFSEHHMKIWFFNYPLAWNSIDDRAWFEFSDDKPIYTINNSVVFIGCHHLT
jgi:hypothetical protein